MSESVLLILALGASAWLWYTMLGQHENVLLIIRKLCTELDLQLLDESVTLQSVFPTRVSGRIILRRRYTFDFSTNGVDRYKAVISLLGAQFEWVDLQHPDGQMYIDMSNPSGK